MEDQSYLDKKYFVDRTVYNCPFCNRRNVHYWVKEPFEFDWSSTKKCHGFIVECSSCGKRSMHLCHEFILDMMGLGDWQIKDGLDIDTMVFYSVPVSSFALDARIPKTIRELVNEAEGCRKLNFLTGASACTRKAIYELLIIEKAEGVDYESRIKSLKKKYTGIDSMLFDGLAHIQDMTSEKVHEQSWDKWDSSHLRLILETLKMVLYEMYVLPDDKKQRLLSVQQLREALVKGKKAKKKREDEEGR